MAADAIVWLRLNAYFRAVEGSPTLAARKTRYNVCLRRHYTMAACGHGMALP